MHQEPAVLVGDGRVVVSGARQMVLVVCDTWRDGGGLGLEVQSFWCAGAG